MKDLSLRAKERGIPPDRQYPFQSRPSPNGPLIREDLCLEKGFFTKTLRLPELDRKS